MLALRPFVVSAGITDGFFYVLQPRITPRCGERGIVFSLTTSEL